MEKRKRVGVIGGGISGLVCAYELKKAGAEVVVFERDKVPGGRMSSKFDEKGMFADLGANFYRGDNKYIKHYCKELDVPYMSVPPLSRQVYYKGRRIRTEFFPWKDSILGQKGVLKNKMPLIKLSLQGLFFGKTMYDLTQTKSSLCDEPIETLAKQISEDFDHYVCAAPIEGLTFYGTDKMTHAFLVNGSRQSVISLFTKRHYSGAMQTIPVALSRGLEVMNETVTQVAKQDNGVVVETKKGTREQFDAVVIATPNTKDFFEGSPEHKEFINNTEYSQTVAGGFTVPIEAINDFAMLYIPHRESNIVSIVLNEGRKQVIDGKAILGFATHHKATAELLSTKSDEEVGQIIRDEIIRLMPEYADILSDAPLFVLKRWKHAIPVYTPGQIRRTHEFLKNGQGVDGIYITGDLLATPFVEGSMTSGNKTARAVIEDLKL